MEDLNNLMMLCKNCSDKLKKEFQDKHSFNDLEIGKYVKIAIKENKEVEHLWFEIISLKKDRTIKGRCANTPFVLKNIKENDIKEFKFKDIEDLK